MRPLTSGANLLAARSQARLGQHAVERAPARRWHRTSEPPRTRSARSSLASACVPAQRRRQARTACAVRAPNIPVAAQAPTWSASVEPTVRSPSRAYCSLGRLSGLMVGILVDQHHRQQARPGKAPGDDMERRRRLRDLLAGTAAELVPDVLRHEPLPRNHIERLGDILADLRQVRAAAACACGRRRVDNPPPLQMSREVPARCRAPRQPRDSNRCRRGLRVILRDCRGEFLELQLHLIEKSLATLGARTERRALHLGDHHLQLLDQRLGAGEPGACFDQRRLQPCGVLGEMISGGCHPPTQASITHVNAPRGEADRFSDRGC